MQMSNQYEFISHYTLHKYYGIVYMEFYSDIESTNI